MTYRVIVELDAPGPYVTTFDGPYTVSTRSSAPTLADRLANLPGVRSATVELGDGTAPRVTERALVATLTGRTA